MRLNIIHSLFASAVYEDSALTLLVSKCRANHFTGDASVMFSVLKEYSDKNLRVDKTLFSNSCQQRGISNEVIDLVLSAPYSLESLDGYIENVLFESTKHQASKLQGAINVAISQSTGRQELLCKIEQDLDKCLFSDDFSGDDETVSVKEALPSYLELLKKNASIKDGIIGIKTPFDGINKLMRGLVPKDLILVGARPSMGKTAFVISVLREAIRTSMAGIIFSLEMPTEQILTRSISCYGGIKQDNLKTGRLSKTDQISFENAIDELQKANLLINDKAGITISEIKRIAYNHHKKTEGGLKFIAIDYLQLMSDSDVTGDTRAQKIGQITIALKGLAKELNIPIILLSQLSRDLEKRNDKRPINSDLRDSGAIEQDADVIIFLYRDEVYNEKSKDAGIAEIIISKQRNGPLGTVKAKFEGEYARFSNLPLTSP